MTRLEYGLVALIFVQITILFGFELYKPERSVAASKSQLLINIQSASVREIAFDSEEVDLKLKKVYQIVFVNKLLNILKPITS